MIQESDTRAIEHVFEKILTGTGWKLFLSPPTMEYVAIVKKVLPEAVDAMVMTERIKSNNLLFYYYQINISVNKVEESEITVVLYGKKSAIYHLLKTPPKNIDSFNQSINILLSSGVSETIEKMLVGGLMEDEEGLSSSEDLPDYDELVAKNKELLESVPSSVTDAELIKLIDTAYEDTNLLITSLIMKLYVYSVLKNKEELAKLEDEVGYEAFSMVNLLDPFVNIYHSLESRQIGNNILNTTHFVNNMNILSSAIREYLIIRETVIEKLVFDDAVFLIIPKKVVDISPPLQRMFFDSLQRCFNLDARNLTSEYYVSVGYASEKSPSIVSVKQVEEEIKKGEWIQRYMFSFTDTYVDQTRNIQDICSAAPENRIKGFVLKTMDIYLHYIRMKSSMIIDLVKNDYKAGQRLLYIFSFWGYKAVSIVNTFTNMDLVSPSLKMDRPSGEKSDYTDENVFIFLQIPKTVSLPSNNILRVGGHLLKFILGKMNSKLQEVSGNLTKYRYDPVTKITDLALMCPTFEETPEPLPGSDFSGGFVMPNFSFPIDFHTHPPQGYRESLTSPITKPKYPIPSVADIKGSLFALFGSIQKGSTKPLASPRLSLVFTEEGVYTHVMHNKLCTSIDRYFNDIIIQPTSETKKIEKMGNIVDIYLITLFLSCLNNSMIYSSYKPGFNVKLETLAKELDLSYNKSEIGYVVQMSTMSMRDITDHESKSSDLKKLITFLKNSDSGKKNGNLRHMFKKLLGGPDMLKNPFTTFKSKLSEYIDNPSANFAKMIEMMKISIEIFKNDIILLNRKQGLPEIDITTSNLLDVRLFNYSSESSEVIIEYADMIGIIPLSEAISRNTANNPYITSFEKEHSGLSITDYFQRYGDFLKFSQFKSLKSCDTCKEGQHEEDPTSCAKPGKDGDYPYIPVVPSS